MKTKSELMAELEKDAEVIRKHFNGAFVKGWMTGQNNTLRINIRDHAGPEICGNEFEYRPDPVAPADGRAVIVGNGNGISWMRISMGEFDKYGNLKCFSDQRDGSQDYCFWENWCDYLNRDHHSPGWRKEWEPKE